MKHRKRIFDGPIDHNLAEPFEDDPSQPDNEDPPPPGWQPWYSREEPS